MLPRQHKARRVSRRQEASAVGAKRLSRPLSHAVQAAASLRWRISPVVYDGVSRATGQGTEDSRPSVDQCASAGWNDLQRPRARRRPNRHCENTVLFPVDSHTRPRKSYRNSTVYCLRSQINFPAVVEPAPRPLRADATAERPRAPPRARSPPRREG